MVDWTGAGILFVQTRHGVRHFLLGKDFTRTWADLGGRRKSCDASPYETAIREAEEEMLGVFTPAEIRGFRVLQVIQVHSYVCYVIEVPEGVSVCMSFLAKLGWTSGYTRLEVTKLLWFPILDPRHKIAIDDHGKKHTIRDRAARILHLL